MVQWTDPELSLLEKELERLTFELVELNTEQAEVGHFLARFQAAFNKALGDRITQLLELVMKDREGKAQTEPDKTASYEEAKRDYEQHKSEQESRRETTDISDWNLSEEERGEMKRLFRAASKRCHPDVVPAEHHEEAAAMFRDLNDAYQSGDLERVRRIAEQAATGMFDHVGVDDGHEQRKLRLKARIAAARDALAKARAELDEVKQTATYRSASENQNWDEYFAEQSRRMDEQIERLAGATP